MEEEKEVLVVVGKQVKKEVGTEIGKVVEKERWSSRKGFWKENAKENCKECRWGSRKISRRGRS